MIFLLLLILLLLVVLILYYYFHIKDNTNKNSDIPKIENKTIIEIFDSNAKKYSDHKFINDITFKEINKITKDYSQKLLYKYGANLRIKIDSNLDIESFYIAFISCMYSKYVIVNSESNKYDYVITNNTDDINNKKIIFNQIKLISLESDNLDTLIECSYNPSDIIVDNNSKMSNYSILRSITGSLGFIKERSDIKFGSGEIILTNRIPKNLFEQIVLIFIPIITLANVKYSTDLFESLKDEPSIVLFDDELTKKLQNKLFNNQHSLNRFLGNKIKLSSLGFDKMKFMLLDNITLESKSFLSQLHLNLCHIFCLNETGIISIDLNANRNITSEQYNDNIYIGEPIVKMTIIDDEINVKSKCISKNCSTNSENYYNTKIKGFLERNKLYINKDKFKI